MLALVAHAAGPYAPPAGDVGSTAMPADDPAFLAWADGWEDYAMGPEVAVDWQDPAKALGPAHTENEDVFDVVSLGRGGAIVLRFSRPIADGAGPDFAVFENGLNDGFLELAFVEVSSNGTDFFRFPQDSLTSGAVGAYANIMDATELSGFAGKYRSGFGTPFDLADLPEASGFDRNAVKFVRLVDVVGDGTATDSSGDIIYDPYPTVGSAGFDLDAVGAVHLADEPALKIESLKVAETGFELSWHGVDWLDYVMEGSGDLVAWTALRRLPGVSGRNTVNWTDEGQTLQFYRVRSVEPD